MRKLSHRFRRAIQYVRDPLRLVLLFAVLGLATPAAAAPSTPSVGNQPAGSIMYTINPLPVLPVSGTPGSTVDLYIDGAIRGSVVLREDSDYTGLAVTAPLSLGPHQAYLIARDATGSSPPSGAFTIVLEDATPPPAPTITTPASGATLSTPMLSVTGTGSKQGAAIQLSLNGTNIGTAGVQDGGTGRTWMFNYPKPLTPGAYVLEARERGAGDPSIPTTVNFEVANFGPPPMPTLRGPLRRRITNLELLEGRAEPLSMLFVTIDGAALTPIQTISNGRWFIERPDIALSEGPHAIDIRAENSAGPSATAHLTLIVDRTPPSTPVLITPASGSVFTDKSQVFSGTAEPNMEVTIGYGSCSESVAAVAIADAAGNWSVVPYHGNFERNEQIFYITGRDEVRLRAPCVLAATWRANPTSGSPPTAAPVSAQAVSGQGETMIPLSATGVFTSFGPGGASPDHGTVRFQGGFAFYTPAAAYVGSDSFTYVATGPGGTSTPAIVSVNVVAPPVPTAEPVSATVPFESTGFAIPLSPSGVFTTLQISTQPAHGQVSLADQTATYIPDAGYSGADSFQYEAIGPGGQSSPGTVSITVSPAVVPGLGEVGYLEIAPLQPGETSRLDVDLSRISSSGVTGFRVTQAPRFGSVDILASGTPPRFQLRYTSPADAMGQETFRIEAFGPGGTSPEVNFAVNVAGRAPDLNGSVALNQSLVFLPLANLRGGPFQGLRIVRGPAAGHAVVDGNSIAFHPEGAAFGTVEIAYVILLPFGQSGEGIIRITGNPPPAAQDLRAETIAGRPVTVRITDGVQGGPFTAADLESISPAAAGAVQITAGGAAGARTYDLTFTPQGSFAGDVVVGYRLSNAFGTAVSRLTVTVNARPDPSLDPEVSAIAAAQVMSAHRFSQAQMSNIQRRLERLRDGDNESASDLNLNLMSTAVDPRASLPQFLYGGAERAGDARFAEETSFFAARLAGVADASAATVGGMRAAEATNGNGTGIGVWAGGSIDWVRDEQKGQRDRRVTSQGLSAGMDVRLAAGAIAGFAAGYGQDRTRIGDAGSVVEGESLTGMLYASVRATDTVFIDGAVGIGRVDLKSERWAPALGGQPAAFASGARSGDILFASTSIGQTGRSANMNWSYYGRLDTGRIRLDPFTETGPAFASLAWEGMEQKSLAAALGGTMSWSWDLRDRGVLSPNVRLEWGREFEGTGFQTVSYADWFAGPDYRIRLDQWSRDTLRINLGLDWRLKPMEIGIAYRGEFGSSTSANGGDVALRWRW